MHEMALCESLLGVLRREAQAQHFTRVKVVRLQLGAMSCVSPEALNFCFQAASRGTLARRRHAGDDPHPRKSLVHDV